ncbi:type-2Aa cytolytic delta-endotoxin [Streptomyces sp. NRRL S-118]|uniref:type-2Aa cytolytic delta-endotoxin n=1 Tax=Streptomyces sp. NRRL S-118 TaxID=1463881 RepID=UPI0004C60202|nr:type-2Aa cytolytic delta-endotoxin [Streptomyces sp. NRRL S-118]
MAEQPAAEKTTFLPVFEVGPAHLSRARGIEGKFQHAIAPATVNFDFGEISRAAAAIPDGSTVRIIRGWGLQETAPVSVMVLSLTEAVRQALSRPFTNPRFWRKAEEALTGAFVGLGRQEGTHLSFYEDTAERTSYYYNLLLALQDEETDGHLYAVALCLDATLGVDGEKARSLSAEDTARCHLRVNAIAVRQPLGDTG